MNNAKLKAVNRKKRALRVRKRVAGTSDRPRLCVRRSLKHIYAQLVDDETGRTLIQVSSSAHKAGGGEEQKESTKSEKAKAVGERIAEIALEKGIKKAVFDRKGYPYHGRIKILADAARAKGLSF